MPIRFVKKIAALVVLVSFFLPLSRWSWNRPVDEGRIVYEIQDMSAFSTIVWPSIEGLVAAVLFGWPAVVQSLAFRKPYFEFRRGVLLLELVLSGLTILGVSWFIYSSRDIRYGAALTYTGVFAYVFAAIASRRGPRHPNSTVDRDARNSGERPSP